MRLENVEQFGFDPSRIGAKVKAESDLVTTLLKAARTHGRDQIILEDHQPAALTYANFISRSFVLSRLIGRFTRESEKCIGLMLPTSIGYAAAFFGTLILGRVPTMINFNSGAANIMGACAAAEVRTIITSRAFIEKAGLGLLVKTIRESGVRVVALEDMRARLSLFDRLTGLAAMFVPDLMARLIKPMKPEDPAVILFTSGSEGGPKGVALSHKNLLANIAQFTSRLDVGAWDRMFMCLPMFHSFGLTVGLLLPVLTGMRAFLYPSPLHYHEIPTLIAEHESTLLLTTDTFLTGYARTGGVEHFHTLRYIVAGAEKLKSQTRKVWKERFGKTIFEGYGVTETAPVLAVNTPDYYQEGSVGRLLPDIEVRLLPVEGLAKGAELSVRGPNVMLGYMQADAPGVIVPSEGGWHNTGDVVEMNDDGYLSICGRIKRFAKVGGEMVSLTAIEQAVAQIWPETVHAVVSVPHERKGETIVLLTERDQPDIDELYEGLKGQGLHDLSLPRRLMQVAKVPVLGSGKIDYIGARQMVFEEDTLSPLAALESEREAKRA